MAKEKPRTKTHPRAKLKLLPEETREDIFRFSHTKSIDETIAYTTDVHGVKVSRGCMVQFLQFQRLQRQSEQLDRDQETLKTILRGHKPKLSAIELDQYAEALFKIRAIQEMDARTYVDVTSHRRKLDLEEIKVQQRDREIALAEKRLKLQVQQAEEAKALSREPTLSPEERERRLRQIFELEPPPIDE